MKVGLYSPYLQTLGGGERYFLTVAEFFLNRGDDVEIVNSSKVDLAILQDRFKFDLNKVSITSTLDSGKYDLLFFVSDGSLPISWSKKTWVHFQVPFNNPRLNNFTNRVKFLKIDRVICNSKFTKNVIDKAYGIKSDIVYPPVEVSSFEPGKKENIILSVGRFFSPSHPKKQEIMVREFVNFYRQGFKDWKLILIGGVTLGSEIESLKKKCSGYPIKIIPDADFKTLQEYYARSKIYWHAAGYGENLELYPDKAEHFGISTVEAMSAGCVPICFAGGGQLEIVDDNKNGLLWKTTEQLLEKTAIVARNNSLRQELSQNAQMKAKKYSKEMFFKQLGELL